MRGAGAGAGVGRAGYFFIVKRGIKEGIGRKFCKGSVEPAHQLAVDLRLSHNAQVPEVNLVITITSIKDDLGECFIDARGTNLVIARLFTVALHRLHNLSVLDFTETVP
jgi:hypothetical protein